MSYANPIDTATVQQVIDDLEDCNAHTICDLLRGWYGLKGRLPDDVTDRGYDAARDVFHGYRLSKTTVLAGECPNHGGAFDCTPFCSLCEGNQEVSK